MDTYEKKYEDAYEIAARKHKIMMEQGSTLAAGLLEELFPELRESEDERIMKELINYLQEHDDPDCPRWIACLEKQKEQKCLPGFDDMTPEEKMNHPLYLEGFDAGREVGKVEAEQKPKWSEEDSGMLTIAVSVLKQYGHPDVAYWLKSFRPRWKPSEEQMKILKAVEDYVAQISGYWEQGLDSLYNELKLLRNE